MKRHAAVLAGLLFAAPLVAQAGPRIHVRHYRVAPRVVVTPGYGYPYGYGYADPFYAYDPFFASSYRFAARPVENTGKLEIEHAPDDATVYINGGYAGTIDDEDTFHLRPGSYDVEVRQRDRILFHQGVYVSRGNTMHIDTATGEISD